MRPSNKGIRLFFYFEVIKTIIIIKLGICHSQKQRKKTEFSTGGSAINQVGKVERFLGFK